MQPLFMDDLYDHADNLSRSVRQQLYQQLNVQLYFHPNESILPQDWRYRCQASFAEYLPSIKSSDDLLLMGPDISDPQDKDNINRVLGNGDHEPAPLFVSLSTVACQIDRDMAGLKLGERTLLYLLDAYIPFSRTGKDKVLKTLPPVQKISFLMTGEGAFIGVYLGPECATFIPAEQCKRSENGALIILISKDSHIPYHHPVSKAFDETGYIKWQPNLSENVGFLPQEYATQNRPGIFGQFLSLLAFPFTSVASLFYRRYVRILSTEQSGKTPLQQPFSDDAPRLAIMPHYEQSRLPLVSGKRGTAARFYGLGSDSEFQQDAKVLTTAEIGAMVQRKNRT